ncbi:MAG: gamma carbonic anhydrase family protein [Bryobacterales bacterium]|nr:gamma carbonic anhydrase family protein [Bryobacterales bacterium]
MIRSYKGITPVIPTSCYIDLSAQVIGDVVFGEHCSVWCNVTIRGDVNKIRIGAETNVQDNCCLHVEHDICPLTIGNRVTIGHSVNLHGCTIEDDAVIGIGAIVLNDAVVGKGSVIAAGALVPERMVVPPYSMVMGVPGKVVRPLRDDEKRRFSENAANYLKYKKAFKDEVF